MTTHRIFLKTTDIALLEGVGIARASALHIALKDSLGKTKRQKVTIKEYCDDRGIDYSETSKNLGLTK